MTESSGNKLPLKVVLVEEEASDIEKMCTYLEESTSLAAKVTTTLTTTMLLSQLGQEDFDIILLDLKVAGEDALRIIDEVHGVAPHVPMIILTDLDNQVFSIDAVHHGVQDYLVKSLLDSESLSRSILYAVERNQLRLRLREEQERNAYLATHDPLTDLPNRKLLQDRFEQQLARQERYKTGFAVAFVDLDKFKDVNDNYGHVVGDSLLQAVSLRLQHSLRRTDTVARMGGDEFVLLITHLTDVQNIFVVGDKLAQLFDEPFECEGHSLTITASIGIALVPEDGHTRDDILNKADQAMYRVKRAGGRGYQLYNPF